MGLILGKITVETPNYELLHKSPDYEIRKYPPCVAAQVTYDPAQLNNNRDGGFVILANYIGALGEAQNSKPAEKIAMTAPVITSESEKIAMTAPVMTSGGGTTTMRFLLPAKYRKAEEAPRPRDERVVIKEEGERKYGVARFSGRAAEGEVKERAERLKTSLERDGFKVVGEFLLARYNPPWTLPPLRTNEIMVPVE
ncbi:uncharacterized protein A4U43_C07F17990 [Asparagus officinalis]|uniref:SOUL heme-binding protein n=1 Tax=Asparagus officinalis TaxID=4686 RepID=A0A5P1EG79_ASPOF|nr:heme-binding-like protein At3g10130, chloroplastic [Asparagus officinalis]ONK63701.1 uncharacterized protein A4U43_C07F17990 [Asparagus officinalis]